MDGRSCMLFFPYLLCALPSNSHRRGDDLPCNTRRSQVLDLFPPRLDGFHVQAIRCGYLHGFNRHSTRSLFLEFRRLRTYRLVCH